MGQVCRRYGGKGWRWTGHERVLCGACGGGLGELPPERRRGDGPPVADPVRSAVR
jgi:hypothetical protein